MGYDSDFVSDFTVPIPLISVRLRSVAFNGGVPVDHTRFSIVFNQDRKFAIFTAHNVDGDSIIPEGRIRRVNNFRLDPDVPANLQVDNDQGYVRNPWDRGHLVRRRALHWGDETEATRADSESFYWTNITPQHERLHDSAWGSIEDWMFDAVEGARQRSCVFTGPVMTPDDPERRNQPNEQPIRIPAGFWKIIALKNRNTPTAAGFVVWQRDFDKAVPVEFDPILEQVRISTIEYLTGLTFSALRDVDPLRFGAQVESRDGRRSLRAGTAAQRASAITRPEDIYL